jgi:hypothetical protein
MMPVIIAIKILQSSCFFRTFRSGARSLLWQ